MNSWKRGKAKNGKIYLFTFRKLFQSYSEVAIYWLRSSLLCKLVQVEHFLDSNGASWASTWRCGRTRNPTNDAACSRSWSAIGSTVQLVGSPPPPIWSKGSAVFGDFRNEIETLKIFYQEYPTLHSWNPYWHAAYGLTGCQSCLSGLKFCKSRFILTLKAIRELNKGSPGRSSLPPARTGCLSSWPQRSTSLKKSFAKILRQIRW